MNHFITNEQKLINIIFANRNQAYGAYAIRSSYGETVFKSLAFMILGAGLLSGISYYLSHKNDDTKLLPLEKEKDSVYVIPIILPPEEIEKPEEKKINDPPAPELKTDHSLLSTIIIDSTRAESMDTSAQLSISNKTLDLSGSEITGNSSVTNSAVSTGTVISDTKPPIRVRGRLEVDTPPEFEGGLAALYRFISVHLKYPEIASREGQEGKVYVRFVVDEHGNVGDLLLMNRVGYGMDEEALRVVSMIPKFKSPARVKGEAVKVYFQLPIRFNYR